MMMKTLSFSPAHRPTTAMKPNPFAQSNSKEVQRTGRGNPWIQLVATHVKPINHFNHIFLDAGYHFKRDFNSGHFIAPSHEDVMVKHIGHEEHLNIGSIDQYSNADPREQRRTALDILSIIFESVSKSRASKGFSMITPFGEAYGDDLPGEISELPANQGLRSLKLMFPASDEYSQRTLNQIGEQLNTRIEQRGGNGLLQMPPNGQSLEQVTPFVQKTYQLVKALERN
jgi:hypothetical protein